MKQEKSTCLTSDYTTKLHLSRQYALAQRQKYNQWNKIERMNQHTLSLTKEAKIYNGEKKISLKSDAGKTAQPPVKE